MSAATTPYEQHRQRVRWMENTEALRRRVSISSARRVVARLADLSTHQLAAIRKGRLKDLRVTVGRKIDHAFVRALEREIGKLNHELEVAKACGVAPDRERLGAALASRDALMALRAEARTAGRDPSSPGEERSSC